MAKPLSDLTGQRFGTLRVITRAPSVSSQKNSRWTVECETCHHRKEIQRGDLLRLRGTGCRFCNHREDLKRQLIGQKIDRVTVVGFVGADKHHKLLWQVRCDCGAEFNCVTSYLRRRRSAGRFACNSCLRKLEDEAWFWSYRIAEMRSNAKTRGLAWQLSDNHARNLMQSACTYCGSPPIERSRNRQDRANDLHP